MKLDVCLNCLPQQILRPCFPTLPPSFGLIVGFLLLRIPVPLDFTAAVYSRANMVCIHLLQRFAPAIDYKSFEVP